MRQAEDRLDQRPGCCRFLLAHKAPQYNEPVTAEISGRGFRTQAGSGVIAGRHAPDILLKIVVDPQRDSASGLEFADFLFRSVHCREFGLGQICRAKRRSVY
jgi:hypothetical protein